MKYGLDAFQAMAYAGTIQDRTDVGGKPRFKDVEPNDFVLQVLQGPNQGLA
jgi:hypothetical protein